MALHVKKFCAAPVGDGSIPDAGRTLVQISLGSIGVYQRSSAAYFFAAQELDADKGRL
jgi:hypothetical protein